MQGVHDPRAVDGHGGDVPGRRHLDELAAHGSPPPLVGARVRQGDEVLDEDEAEDVVEIVLIDRQPRVLLVDEQVAQLGQGRTRLHRDDVGARGHHFAHHRVAELDHRLQELPLRAFVDLGVEPALRRVVRAALPVRRRPVRIRPIRAGPAQPVGQRARHRAQHAGHRVERRQQDRQHPLGTAAHDQQRQHVPARQRDHDEAGEPEPHAGAAGFDEQQRQRGDQRDGHGLQHAGGHEQAGRLLQVVPEQAGLAVPFGVQPQGQPHQDAERRLHRPDVQRRAREQEQQQGNHGAPSARPPRRHSRRSKRAIWPLSRAWS